VRIFHGTSSSRPTSDPLSRLPASSIRRTTRGCGVLRPTPAPKRLDAVLNDAARTEPTYLDFLDSVLRQEVDAKQRTHVAMGLKIAASRP
jgi:hypothetical protein